MGPDMQWQGHEAGLPTNVSLLYVRAITAITYMPENVSLPIFGTASRAKLIRGSGNKAMLQRVSCRCCCRAHMTVPEAHASRSRDVPEAHGAHHRCRPRNAIPNIGHFGLLGLLLLLLLGGLCSLTVRRTPLGQSLHAAVPVEVPKTHVYRRYALCTPSRGRRCVAWDASRGCACRRGWATGVCGGRCRRCGRSRVVPSRACGLVHQTAEDAHGRHLCGQAVL